MGMKGKGTEKKDAGKLLAVLWILTAALAMHFVASAQGLSARFSAQHSTGNFSIPESGTSDTALSRQAVRAVPVAELRFAADRSDGKAAPGGTGPFILPGSHFNVISAGVVLTNTIPHAAVARAEVDAVRVRGPPVLHA